MAGKYKVYLVMGAIERDGYTLYCTVLFFNSQGCDTISYVYLFILYLSFDDYVLLNLAIGVSFAVA